MESARLAFERSREDGRARHRREGAVRPGADSVRRCKGTGRRRSASRSMRSASAVALARDNAEQVAMRRSQLEASRISRPPPTRSGRRRTSGCAYTEIHAPIDGIVDVRAAREGEVVTPGQPIVTLINPDDLWVRVDVEETYIDRVRIGDTLTVRLPSGVERAGHRLLPRRRRRLRHPARRQPHQARHQDVRDPASRRQSRPPPGGRHDGVRIAACGRCGDV